MLKITNIRLNESSLIVKLEGKLLQPWVEEVRRHFSAIESVSPPLLDLSQLTFVDRDGVELLRELLNQGIRIDTCSLFIAELLNWRHGENR